MNQTRRGESPLVQSTRVLLLSASRALAERLQEILRGGEGPHFGVTAVAGIDAALGASSGERFAALIIDLQSLGGDRLELLVRARRQAMRFPILVLSDRNDEEESLRALRLGAQEVLDVALRDPATLRRSLRHAQERHRLLRELFEARHRAQYVATHDPLTRLPNRVLLYDHLRRALARAARNGQLAALLFLDLDRFKAVNDTLGHAAGDGLLVKVAERLSSCIRQADMVARLGGDEFVVLLQSIERQHAPAKLAEKILSLLSMPFEVNGREVWLGASIGISVFPRDGLDMDALIRNADVALYHAKARGRNVFQFYSEAMDTAVRQRLEIERRLRSAMEREQLRLVYQPKVRAATGQITGAEALLRWSDGDLGDVSPSDFVPIAEESGLIWRLGDWALRSACAQLAAWKQAGLPDIRMMVNLSHHQIDREGLREDIVRALWDSGLEPGDLVLEVTEGTLARNEQRAVEVLSELKQLGFGISLDDFGTGFSSLNYLKRFPVDSVKIDRAFLRDLCFDQDDAAIVSAVLSIAHQLELNVVAEGVETLDQCEFLVEAGCPEIQGFLFSPPLPPEDFAELLRQGVCGPKLRDR